MGGGGEVWKWKWMETKWWWAGCAGKWWPDQTAQAQVQGATERTHSFIKLERPTQTLVDGAGGRCTCQSVMNLGRQSVALFRQITWGRGTLCSVWCTPCSHSNHGSSSLPPRASVLATYQYLALSILRSRYLVEIRDGYLNLPRAGNKVGR